MSRSWLLALCLAASAAGADKASPPRAGPAASSATLKAFSDSRGLWGYADGGGKTAIEPQYSWAQDFSEGLGAVGVETEEGRRHGYVDQAGRMRVAPRFLLVTPFERGMAFVVFADGVKGLIDKAGRLLTPRNAADLQFGRRSEGLQALAVDGRWGYIDDRFAETGSFFIAPRFDEVKPFERGKARVREGERWAVIGRDFPKTGRFLSGKR